MYVESYNFWYVQCYTVLFYFYKLSHDVIKLLMINPCLVLLSPQLGKVAGRYTCMVCQRGFNSVDSLRSHHDKNHSSIGFINPCFSLTDTPPQLLPFTLTPPPPGFVHPAAVHTLDSLMRRAQRPHAQQANRVMFQCACCSKEYTTQLALNKHLALLHPQHAPFKCELCSKGFPEQRLLNKHIAVECDYLDLKSYLDEGDVTSRASGSKDSGVSSGTDGEGHSVNGGSSNGQAKKGDVKEEEVVDLDTPPNELAEASDK